MRTPHSMTDGGPAVARSDSPTKGRIASLIRRMEEMPSHPTVSMRVVRMTDDPRTTLNSLAEAIELDPILSAQLLRIANSAYYSLRTPVANVPRAVTVLGFSTVRALAAAASSGLRHSEHPIPLRFWQHSAAVANACQLISTRYDVPTNDAFALGLLHDLGSGLLYMTDPTAWVEIERTGVVGGELEIELFGVTHQVIGSRVLEAWRFPREFCDAVARHHQPLSPREASFTRCLIAGQMVASLALESVVDERAAVHREVLLEHDFDDAQLERIIDRVAVEYGALAAVLAETVGAS